MVEMTATEAERSVTLDEKVYERLTRAKKEGETVSDVITRLISTKLLGLRRRGEEKIVTSDDKTLSVSVDQDLCLGAESCVAIAPEAFALDEKQLGRRVGTEPLGIIEVEDKTVDSETIIRAARSCPYRAITVKDGTTGDVVAP